MVNTSVIIDGWTQVQGRKRITAHIQKILLDTRNKFAPITPKAFKSKEAKKRQAAQMPIEQPIQPVETKSIEPRVIKREVITLGYKGPDN